MADFSKFANIKDKTPFISLSSIYRVHKGGFGSNIEGIKTYFTSAPVATLKGDLETFEKLTKNDSWPVSQIIQREIDINRIKRIANQYILSDRSIKYFPPIIAAILPKDDKRGIANQFPKGDASLDEKEYIFKKSIFSEDESFKPTFLEAESLSKISGFYALDIFPAFNSGIISWDKSKLYAIVIDGQHRLESLKKSLEYKTEIGEHIQDVVFIDVSERSFQAAISPVEAVRRIFIDINYSAVPVTQVRKCLMDDQDLASLFLQSLVNDDDPEGERVGSYIYPQLIDWHSENLKHQLPHITGILTLYQLMSDVVLQKKNLSSISDLWNWKKVKQFVHKLNSRFNVDQLIREKSKYEEVTQLQESLIEYETNRKSSDDDDDELILFDFDYQVLEVAQQEFEDKYCPSIVKFFTQVRHYKMAIELLEAEHVFDKDYSLNRVIVQNPSKLNDDQKDLFSSVRKKLESALNSKYYLLFTVLGQKTLFEIYYKNLEEEIGGIVEKENIESITHNFIKKINKVLEVMEHSPSNFKLFGDKPNEKNIENTILDKHSIGRFGNLASSFWEGVIYKDRSIIYNNQGVGSLKSVIEYVWKTVEENEHIKSAQDLMPLGENEFKISYAEKRIERRLKEEHDITSERQNKASVEDIFKAKKEFLDNYIIEAITQYKSKSNLN